MHGYGPDYGDEQFSDTKVVEMLSWNALAYKVGNLDIPKKENRVF